MTLVLLATLNTSMGAVAPNTERALAALEEGARRGAALVVFPEGTLTGYPAKDRLMRASFIRGNLAALERLARATAAGPACLVGFAEPHPEPVNGLHNAAALCRGGRVEAVYRKRLLPTYDVFDEARYFDAGSGPLVFGLEGFRLGVTICEDLWCEAGFSPRHYAGDPAAESARAGAEVVVNLSASPYGLGKEASRRAMLARAARRSGAPVLYVNQVGGCDDILFDGTAFAYGADGALRGRLPALREDFLEVRLERGADGAAAVASSVPAEEWEHGLDTLRGALAMGIGDYVRKCGAPGVLLGLSGGIDSALVAALAAEALGPGNVHGVAMPTRNNSPASEADARELAERLGIRFSVCPIEGLFATAAAGMGPLFGGGEPQGLARENLQSRLRALTLMTLSNATGALVLACGNKSELCVGYCTLYGDTCGAISPIGDLYKGQVYELSRHINARAGRELIPAAILDKEPTAELRPGQRDADDLPPYEALDPILRLFADEGLSEADVVALGHDAAFARRVAGLFDRNEYKRRQTPPALKAGPRAFGFGWRQPVATGPAPRAGG
ncbi:MAG: NAD+ synthase [Candidatus Sumerlaeia bacterium]|nr:NAD+ synthase [Candidatus Sumerlaeia bacterium]